MTVAETSALSAEARLQRLEDIEAIQQIIARYAWYASKAEGEQMYSLFVIDGIMDSGGQILNGQEALRDYFSRLEPGQTIPHLQNFMINIRDDEAFSRCQMLTPWIGVNKGTCGWYEDHLRRQNGTWRFVSRKWTRHQIPAHHQFPK